MSIELEDTQRIGVVGSETTTDQINVDLISTARNRPTNGRMVIIGPTDEYDEHEYAIGTVTSITNRNRFHEDPALRGIIALRGAINGLTQRADIKSATIDVQATFRETTNGIRTIGGSMSFAPDTGENIYLLDSQTVRTLSESVTNDLYYIGTLYRQAEVNLPLSVGDFSSARGALNAGYFGPSGSGKTHLAIYDLACRMRHTNMGFLVVDPQGQFTNDRKVHKELPLDIRALADAQGRPVHQLSVARQVRLPEDPELFVNLLGSTRFFSGADVLGLSNKSKDVQSMVIAWLSEQTRWSDQDPATLLNELVEYLMRLARTGSIFAGIKEPKGDDTDLPDVADKPANRLYHNLRSVLHPGAYDPDQRNGTARRQALLSLFSPFLNLFGATTPDGTGERQKIGKIVEDLTDTDTGYAGRRKARPLYLLTMADTAVARDSGEAEMARALSTTKTQGVILKTLLSALERKAQWQYQERNDPANVTVFIDEAARYTSVQAKRGEMSDLPEDIARYFREIRKYAVGFMLVLQEPSALEESIWKQLRNGYRVFGGGLVGNDLDKVREQVGAGGSMRLYQQLAQPSHDNPVYPFMVCGTVSPLSATSSPLFMEAFSGPNAGERWKAANAGWVPGVFNTDDLWAG